MNIKRFALIGGTIMLLVGALSFIPSLSRPPFEAGLPALTLDTSYGQFLGFLPMNVLNKLTLIGFGLIGILASISVTRSLPASIGFSRWVLYIMGPLAILGVIPQTQTLGGYWPLFGADAAVHAVFAILGGYFGFSLTSRAARELHERFPNRDKLDTDQFDDKRRSA
jgi:hypothetical protein